MKDSAPQYGILVIRTEVIDPATRQYKLATLHRIGSFNGITEVQATSLFAQFKVENPHLDNRHLHGAFIPFAKSL